MDADDATSVAARVLRRRPTEVLPPFVAESATGVIVQTILLGAGGGAYLSLRGSGRLERAGDAVTGALEGGQPTPAEIAAVRDAAGALVTPTVAVLVAAGVLVSLAAVVLFRSVVGAAKVHAARAAVLDARDDRQRAAEERSATGLEPDGGTTESPLTAAVRGAFADTRTFVGLTLLQASVVLLPLVLVAGGGALVVVGALAAVPAVLVAYVGFLFAPEAIVVDGAGPVEAVRRNLSYLRRHPGRAAVYVVVEVGAVVLALLVGGLLGLAGVGRVGDVLLLFVVLPWLGLVRMALYLPDRHSPTGASRESVGVPASNGGEESAPTGDDGWTGAVDPETDTETPTATGPAGDGGVEDAGSERSRGVLAALLAGQRAGVRELRGFLAAHWGLVLVAMGVFGVGVAVGGALGPRATRSIAGDPGAVFGTFPLGTAVELALNNWLVAVSETYGGLALGVPTVGNLLFNGLVVGGLSGLFEPRVFLSLVVPHAIVEVPALSVGGAVGLHLGREGVRLARRQMSATAFATELRRSFLVLVGLVPVFLVAGVIEAFVTPLVGSLVGGR